jgi:hypothetical protein
LLPIFDKWEPISFNGSVYAPLVSDAGADQSQGYARAYSVSDNQNAEQRPANPTVYASIEQVDFRNFTFPLSMCVEPNKPTQVAVKNGTFEGQDVLVNIDKEIILYTDLTDDKSNEAIIPVYCSPPVANFNNVEIHIYTLRDGKPELLTKLDDDIFAADYKRYYQDTTLWPSITQIAVTGKKLTVYKLADGSRACPENQVSFDYLWNGKSFTLFDKPVKTPAIDCGHNGPNVAGNSGAALQVQKAREVFWREFMNEPAIEIASTIARKMLGDPAATSYRLGKSQDPADLPHGPRKVRGRDLISEGVIKFLRFEKNYGLPKCDFGRYLVHDLVSS